MTPVEQLDIIKVYEAAQVSDEDGFTARDLKVLPTLSPSGNYLNNVFKSKQDFSHTP